MWGQKLAAILLGKSIIKITRALKIGGGSAAPGLYALKIDTNLTAELTKNIPKTVIITGTNGKTTTSKLLADFASDQGLRVIKNSTGSNLERGIASSLISAATLLGGQVKGYDLAIWELDEAAFNTVAPKLNPQIVVFLNVFRDQLDRYGEVDTTVKKWLEVIKNLNKDTTLLINGDDQNLLELKNSFKGKSYTFGIDNFKILGENSTLVKTPAKLDFEAKNIELRGLKGVKFELNIKGDQWVFSLPLPGAYHIYDFLAAYSAAFNLNLDTKGILASIKEYSPAFGRVEKFKDGYIFLIKNPTGATQVLGILGNEIKPADTLILALNDNLADGTDVSWIWDVNFEEFQNLPRIKSKGLNIICSGTRAEELALRLKYAGFNSSALQIQNDLKKALEQARRGLKGRIFLLPTYTALLKLQGILAKEGSKDHYWKEQA